jgi:hypothetical protein
MADRVPIQPGEFLWVERGEDGSEIRACYVPFTWGPLVSLQINRTTVEFQPVTDRAHAARIAAEWRMMLAQRPRS